MDTEAELAEAVGEFYDDPLGYVMFNWPWDSEPEIQMVPLAPQYRERFNSEWGPDVWACEFLDELGAEIRKRAFDGRAPVDPIRFTTASGHGIGKTTLSAFLIKFVMDTRPYCRGTVTAGTDVQLRTKTWAEVGKWHRLSLTRNWCVYTAGRGAMAIRRKGLENEWFIVAQTCREENSEAFQGQHAVNSTSFYLFDEASVVPKRIYEARDGGLTDGEPMVFDFGNPTRNSGMFYENCVGANKHRYIVRSIDSRDVAITSKPDIADKLADHGEDSDYFRVRVRGVFPRASTIQFIGSDLVIQAMQRPVYNEPHAPLILGVDVARFGDNETVIWARKGMDARSFEPRRYTGLDTTQVTGRVIEMVRMFEDLQQTVAAIFVDGTGLGAGVVDQLRHLGYNPFDVSSGTRPTNMNTYRLKGDELWGNLRDALIKGLVLPTRDSSVGAALYDQLTQREYGYTSVGNKIFLESKKDMEKRGVSSPDLADALALTFGMDVAPTNLQPDMFQSHGQKVLTDYDPLEVNW